MIANSILYRLINLFKTSYKTLFLSIDAEKSFGKIIHYFMIKNTQKVDIERMCLSIIKATNDKPFLNIIFKGLKVKNVLRSGTR